MSRKRILFVCTGNTCRSPMAEALARSLLDDRSMEFSSAGISAEEGSPASQHARTVMVRRELDLESHRAVKVDNAILDEADLVLAMEAKHRDRLERFPSSEGKVMLLTEWAGASPPGPGIDDPYGKGENEYEKTA
nr:low molecular weight protein arginine phosphatase [bacterium]